MRYLETKKPRIEIIPMIDIMLFLLVFFVMLALKMIPTSGHVTKLPTSSTASTIPNSKLTVEILPDGSILVDSKLSTLSDLTALLKTKDAANTSVTVVGSDKVSLQQLMTVIDAIKLGGANQISLAAINKSR
jgi:biopolymer transport protein ExbD